MPLIEVNLVFSAEPIGQCIPLLGNLIESFLSCFFTGKNGDEVRLIDAFKVIEVDNVDDWEYLEYCTQKNNNSIYKYLKENYESVK